MNEQEVYYHCEVCGYTENDDRKFARHIKQHKQDMQRMRKTQLQKIREQ